MIAVVDTNAVPRPFLVTFVVLYAIATLIGLAMARRLTTESWAARFVTLASPLTAIVMALTCWWQTLTGTYFVWNGARLAPTFALINGYKLYYSPGQGPVLNTIYGPVTHLAYLPAVLAKTPTGALLIAQAVSILFFFGPMLLLLTSNRRAGLWPAAALVTVGTTFPHCMLRIPGLAYSAFSVHADAPALGLAALACYALTFRHRLGGWALGVASTLCVLSAWTKQNMLPFAAGLILYLWLADGRKMALRFLICFLVAGMAISAALIAVFGARSMYFNMVTLNVRRPWTGPRDSAPSVFHAFFYSIQELTAQSLLPAVILFTLCFATENLREHNLQSLLAKWKGELWFMLMVCAVVLVPSSIMGRTKLGGDSNALSPTLYFFAVAAAVQLLRVAVAPPHPELVAVRRGAILVLGFMAVFAVVTHWPFPADLWRQWERLPGNPQEIAFQEARERPGQIWFPNMPLPSLMAEKKLYHFSHGLEDRERTGFRVSQGHFDAGLPLHVKYAVFESDWMQGTMQKLGYLDEFPKRGTEPQAWTVYIKE